MFWDEIHFIRYALFLVFKFTLQLFTLHTNGHGGKVGPSPGTPGPPGPLGPTGPPGPLVLCTVKSMCPYVQHIC